MLLHFSSYTSHLHMACKVRGHLVMSQSCPYFTPRRISAVNRANPCLLRSREGEIAKSGSSTAEPYVTLNQESYRNPHEAFQTRRRTWKGLFEAQLHSNSNAYH